MAFDWLLDSETNDLVFDSTSKDLVFITNNHEDIRQRVAIKLQTYKGEWFINTDYGVPYLQDIISVARSKSVVDNILKNSAEAETGVGVISNFNSVYGTDNRNYSLTFDINYNNNAIPLQVSLNPQTELTYNLPNSWNSAVNCQETIITANSMYDYVNISGLPPTTGDSSWVNEWAGGSSPTVVSYLKVATGATHSLGLKSNGAVVAVGDNTYGQCNVSAWTDIIDVSAGTGSDHSVGLKSNGTVVATGNNTNDQCDVSSWTNITKISVGGSHTVGLKSDGTAIAVGTDAYGQIGVGTWINLIDVSAGYRHTIGLKSDGTVYQTGALNAGATSSWTNITKITSGMDIAFGLRSNGTVARANGDYPPAWLNTIDTWTNIVDICAGNTFLIGIKADGTTVLAGGYDDLLNIASWTGITSLDAGGGGWYAGHAVGIKLDGTVIANGDNTYGQCNLPA